jgi:type I restriction enzyme R subunit
VNPLIEPTVEDAALSWFKELKYSVAHAPHLAPGEIAAERKSFGDVMLIGRLGEAIARLNPAIPSDAREEALRKILRHDAPSLVGNNRAFHRMLRDGVPVEYRREDGSIAGDHVRLIDFSNPDANDWLAVNQFTLIEGQNSDMREEIIHTLQTPAEVRISRTAADVRLFYEFYSRTAVGDKWLCVVVKYLTDDAFVITAYLTDKLKAGERVWQTK